MNADQHGSERERADVLHEEVADAIHQVMMPWIDQRHAETGIDRRALCVVVGKALVMEGCTFLGNGLAIANPDLTNPEIGLKPGLELLERFKQLATEKRNP